MNESKTLTANTKAVIYARFSSDGQQEESITAQIRACSEYAERNGYTVITEYIDRAVSAKSDKRPEFQKMIKECKAFDVVLVHKYDRFARNRYDHAVYGKMLKDKGVELIAVAENFGNGKEAVLMEGLMQALSEYYIVNLSEEVKKGHKEVALKALHNGGYAPFGYDVINQKYVINELEAIYVRRMFEACLNGSGFTQLLSEMNNAGIKGKRGKPLRYSSIYEILRNEKYTGVYLYCQTEIKDRSKRRLKENAIRIENALPAIVEKDVFERVQKIMDKRKNSGKGAKRIYLLSGLVKCECGANMHALTTSRKGHQYSYYYCPEKCGNPNIREDLVNKAVFSYLNALLNEENKQVLYKALETYTHNSKQNKVISDTSIKKEIADKEKQIQTLMDNLSASVLPPKVIADIGKKITELDEQIETLKIEIIKTPSFSKSEVINYLDIISNLENQPIKLQSSTINRFIENIRINKTSLDVTSTFNEVLRKIGCGSQI